MLRKAHDTVVFIPKHDESWFKLLSSSVCLSSVTCHPSSVSCLSSTKQTLNYANLKIKTTLNLHYLYEVTPNLAASAFAFGASAVRLAILESFEGCVLNSSGGACPLLCALIRFQSSAASSGL